MSYKKSKKNFRPLVGRFLKKLAPRIGAKVFLEPVWGVVGHIVYKSGVKRYFKYSTLDLNPVAASDIAKDKDYSNFFMKKMGYPIVPGSAIFYSKQWAEAIQEPQQSLEAAVRYAQKIGFPVVVKPNSGSQGSGVAFVHTKTQFLRAVRHIFRKDKIVLVSKPVFGKDYRIVVLDGNVISAYERIPLNVVGDGKSSIKKLLQLKERSFIASSRDTRLKIDDPRIKEKLRRQKLDFRSILEKDRRIFLLDNANLSTGGDSIDVTPFIHPEFRKICIQLTKDMGLRICGVDLIIDGDITQKPGKYWIIEVNAAPGLDHYAKSGKEQEKIVEDLYLEVLKSLEK